MGTLRLLIDGDILTYKVCWAVQTVVHWDDGILTTATYIEELKALSLGWKLVKYVKSNAIVFSNDNQLSDSEKKLLEEIAPLLIKKDHIFISTVTGVDISELRQNIPTGVPVFRIMPNVAIAIGESMTCVTCD